VAEAAIGLRAQGRQAEFVAGPEVGLFGVLRTEVAGLRAVVEQRLARDVAEADAVRKALNWLLLGAAVAAVLCVGLALGGLRRGVTRPLAALVESVRRVADGELDRPVPTGGPAEFAAIAAAVERIRGTLDEQDRVASRPVDPDGPGSSAPPPSVLAVRVTDALARVPEQLGVRPDLRVEGAAGRQVPRRTADELLEALDRALDGLVETRARLDALEVEVAVDAEEAAVSLIARGIVPGEWTAEVRGGARRWPGTCRVVDLDPELAVVEWSLPLPR
jgi:HAMP domain-containing protein